MEWIIDGNNVMGSRPDGWWNDRSAAMERLAQEIAEWCWTHDDRVTLVFDGATIAGVAELSGGNLAIRFSERSARNSADDVIVAEATESRATHVVVTADKGLKDRLRNNSTVEGPATFLARIAP